MITGASSLTEPVFCLGWTSTVDKAKSALGMGQLESRSWLKIFQMKEMQSKRIASGGGQT